MYPYAASASGEHAILWEIGPRSDQKLVRSEFVVS